MKISIIIPAYNEEKYLPRLLESIDIARSNYSGGRDTVEGFDAGGPAEVTGRACC